MANYRLRRSAAAVSLLLALSAACRERGRMTRRAADPAVAAVRRAVLSGDVAALDRLLAVNPSLANRPDENGGTPLMHAVSANRYAIVADLLARGANVNARGPGGGTALMDASDAAAIRLLVAHGADLNARDRHGHTALWRHVRAAVGTGPAAGLAARQLAVAQQLLRDGAQEDVFSAAALGDTRALATLLAREPGLANARDGGVTPLFWAAIHCRHSTVAVLLAHGADPRARDLAGQTPAQAAVAQGCLAVAQTFDRRTR